MEKEKIDRINFLAAKARSEALSEEEKREQQALRDEYREQMRKSWKAQLENVYVLDADGNEKKLIRE